MAADRGGLLLSKEYINTGTKLLWQCSKGHQWMATDNTVTMGSWCPYCTNRISHTIEQMRTLAKKHGGLCLSMKYKGNKTKLKWQCKEKHTWKASPNSILQGSWCQLCYWQKRRKNPLIKNI